MATTFFLRNTTESGVSISGFTGEHKLDTSRGPLITTGITDTTASGNHIIALDNAAHSAIWLFQVAAVTISGTVTLNIWGFEDAMATNAQLAVIISRYDSGGGFVSDVIAQGNANHAKGVELGTSSAVQNWTATPTSTTFSAGDWLAVIVHVDASGTMAVGQVSVKYDGTTGSADGDSFVTFTETITAGTPAAANPPYKSPYPQLLAH